MEGGGGAGWGGGSNQAKIGTAVIEHLKKVIPNNSRLKCIYIITTTFCHRTLESEELEKRKIKDARR